MSQTPEPRELEELLRHLPLNSPPEPDALWERIQTEVHAPVDGRAVRFVRRQVRSPWLAAAAVLLAIVGGGTAGLLRAYRAPSAWKVVPLAGAPAVAGDPLTEAGALTTGQWLVTDAVSSARLSVGRIGTVEVGPGSRVRLDRAGLTAHRLTVERGSLHAVISAPPRLFFVETPSVLATDLGCAYTLEVDSAGTSWLHVTSGWVELKQGDDISLVPTGFIAEVQLGHRPGTPYAVELAEDARAALHRLDTGEGSATDLDVVLAAMYTASHNITLRHRSWITLWHLLQRVDPDDRRRVYPRLVSLSAPPSGVTMEGILALDRRMLKRWRADLYPMWSEEAQPWLTRIGRRIWNWAIR